MFYEHTHYSVHDGSPAMAVAYHTDGLITLVNEDGFEWTASQSDWAPYADDKTCPPIPGILE